MAVAVGLWGCIGQPPAAAQTDILRLGSQNTAEASTVLAQTLFAEPLLVIDWRGRPAPGLATQWNWLDEGRAFGLRLRPGVLFHDGTPLTAEIVAAILRKDIKDDPTRAFRYVTSIETPDEHSLIFRLSRPDTFLVEAIAGALIVDDRKPDIGTGPFRILARTPVIQAERNIAYYRGAPGLKRVEVTLYDTQRAVFAAMMRGDVDMVQEVNPESVEFLEGASQFETFVTVRPFYIPLVFNLGHPILRNVEVRRALVEAIDRDEIVRQAMRGHGKIADDPVWPSHWAYNPGARKYTYNPTAARARLDAAGFPIGPPAVDGQMASRFQINCIFYNKDFQFERIALLLQRQLGDVGVDLVLTGVDQRTLVTRAGTGNFDSYVFQMASGKSFDWTYRFWHNGGGYQNSGYSGADEALDLLRRSRTDTEVRAAVANLRQRFYEDAPAAFLAWPERTRAVDVRFDVGDRSDPEILGNLWRWRPRTDLKASR